MSISHTIIKTALEHYDKNIDNNEHLFKDVEYYKFLPGDNNDVTKRSISLYDKDEKEILTAEYEVIGFYFNLERLWVWGWAIPRLHKNTIKTSRKILNYGLDIDYEKNPFLKTKLITSRFKITNKVQLDIHLAIASYIAKNEVVCRIKNNDPSLTETGLTKMLTDDNTDDYTAFYLSLSNIKKA